MLDKFNDLYKLGDKELKRLELENALIEEFNDLHYQKFPSWTERDTGYTHPIMYKCYAGQNWGIYKLESEFQETIEEALMSLFIENDLKDIVEEVYGSNN